MSINFFFLISYRHLPVTANFRNVETGKQVAELP